MRSSSSRARQESYKPDAAHRHSSSRSTPSRRTVHSRPLLSLFPRVADLSTDSNLIPDKTSTLTIIDWDDTLNPSHWCLRSGLFMHSSGFVPEMLRSASGNDKLSIKALSENAARTIQLCMSRGHVVIVTNAEAGWVELSSKVLLPDVYKLLVDVPVMSARSCFQKTHRDSPIVWKSLAFTRLLSERPLVSHVISIGDSLHEREALFIVHQKFSFVAKSVKLRDRPSLFQLVAQHKVLHAKLDRVFADPNSLDLCLANGDLTAFKKSYRTSSLSR